MPSSIARPSLKRAIGVVRVSRVGGRDGEQFVSPSEQAERIAAACKRDGLTLLSTIEELDVSGGAPLAKRHGLRRAVELVEAGKADVVVVAYLNRLVRSLSVQAEVVNRVEQAGGAIMAVDIGALSSASAGQWLSGTMLGAVSEYARRVVAERTQDGKRRAVARGVAPYPNTPPGYRKREDGTLEPHPDEAATVADAFRLRSEGATVMDVRKHLRANGIERSFHGTTSLLASRVMLGELSFGKLVNPDSHPAIIDAATWGAVQRMKSPRGRRAKSERLLARLGILRCGTCGARMVVGSTRQQGKPYAFYRCIPTSDCERRVTISATLAEQVVTEAVQELLAGMKGTASIAQGVDEAARDLDRRQADLDAAIRTLELVRDEDAAKERLAELIAARDSVRDRLVDLEAAAAPAVTVTSADWYVLTVDEKRALIRAVVAEAVVTPGRGRNRITVKAL